MDKIEKIVGVGADERDELIRWYARMNESERLDVHQLQSDLLRQKREQIKPLGHSTGAYAVLVLALARRRRTLTAAERKEHMTPAQAEQVSKMRRNAIAGNRKGRGEGKIAKLVRLRWYHEIDNLREQGLSWREIASWIRKYHKTKVSHTHIKLCFEREQTNRYKQEE